VTEWFVNQPSGIEQGFTLPARLSAGPLELTLQTGGDLQAAIDGTDVVFRHGREPILRYAGLQSRDAQGRALSSRMWLDGRTLRIQVDDRTARYPVTVDPTVQVELIPRHRPGGESYGRSVAVSGGIAVAGAPNRKSNTGAAYVFVKSKKTGEWHQRATLTAADGLPGFDFGISVAVDRSTVLVGAEGADEGVGAGYVFVRSHGKWDLQAKLVPSDTRTDTYSASAVALSGDTAVLGAPAINLASVFTRSGTSWSQEATLAGSAATSPGDFGWSVAVHGRHAVIGSPGNNGQAGAAYVFSRSGSGWSQQARRSWWGLPSIK
jgi:hypothetical protein